MTWRQLIPQLIQLTWDVAAEILPIYQSQDDALLSLKSDGSPLTQADICANRLIYDCLTQLTPDIPIISEESCDVPFEVRKHWRRYWLIDPIDGTKEFLAKNGDFTINIALIDDHKPILGIVAVPTEQQVFYALQGEGAWKIDLNNPASDNGRGDPTGDRRGDPTSNRRGDPLVARSGSGFLAAPNPLRATGGSPLRSPVGSPLRLLVGSPLQLSVGSTVRLQEPLRVVASRRHGELAVNQLGAHFSNIELMRRGSSLKFCLLAEGIADFYPRLGPTSEWDTAAGQCILEEAGGIVADLQGAPLRYNTKESYLNPCFFAAADKIITWHTFFESYEA